VIHRAIERSTGRNWAAKFVACTTIERAMVLGEIDVRNDLRHPNLLQLHEAFETHGEMAFILELYDLFTCVVKTSSQFSNQTTRIHRNRKKQTPKEKKKKKDSTTLSVHHNYRRI